MWDGIVGGAWRGDATRTNVNVTINNCENYGDITSENGLNIGGIVGEARATVENCKNRGNIVGKTDVGGIAGKNTYFNNKSPLISNCKNYGTVYGTGMKVGGICGLNNGGTISKSSNHNTVTLTGDENSWGVGGIVGSNTCQNCDVIVELCYNAGDVFLTGKTQASGICANSCGKAEDTFISQILNCYNVGNVTTLSEASRCRNSWLGTKYGY